MENKVIMQKIQALADEKAKRYIRPAELTYIYDEEKEDGSSIYYCLGSDMPRLVFRIFYVTKDLEVTEEENIQKITELSVHYNRDIKHTLKLVPPSVEEVTDYLIEVENALDRGAVELKLRSSTGRDITLIEVYRYYDFRSRIFFVSCVTLSFNAQYLFTVTNDSKHVRLLLNPSKEILERINIITELLRNGLLPSYRTISDGVKALSQDNKVTINLRDNQGVTAPFNCTFVYDDDESQTRFAFFRKDKDDKTGVILTQDIFNNNKLSLPNLWTEEQKKACERVLDLMKNNRTEFAKHTTSFVTDDLDFRYKAFKDGKLQPRANQTENKPAETTENKTEE